MLNYVWLNLCFHVCYVITSLFNMTMAVFLAWLWRFWTRIIVFIIIQKHSVCSGNLPTHYKIWLIDMYKTAIIIIQNNDVQLSSESTKIHSLILCTIFLQLQSFPLENLSLQESPFVIDKLKKLKHRPKYSQCQQHIQSIWTNWVFFYSNAQMSISWHQPEKQR